MKKGFLKIVLTVVVVLTIGAMLYFNSSKQKVSPIVNTEEITMTVGDREGSFLMQKINRDSVEGLWYRIYPVAREGDAGDAKTLHIGDNIGYACEGVSEVLTKIDFDGQTATFLKTISEPPVGGCPI